MIGASVQGLLGVDAELQRSAFAAEQIRTFEHVAHQRPSEDEIRPVVYERDRDCEPPRSNQLS